MIIYTCCSILIIQRQRLATVAPPQPPSAPAAAGAGHGGGAAQSGSHALGQQQLDLARGFGTGLHTEIMVMVPTPGGPGLGLQGAEGARHGAAAAAATATPVDAPAAYALAPEGVTSSRAGGDSEGGRSASTLTLPTKDRDPTGIFNAVNDKVQEWCDFEDEIPSPWARNSLTVARLARAELLAAESEQLIERAQREGGTRFVNLFGGTGFLGNFQKRWTQAGVGLRR